MSDKFTIDVGSNSTFVQYIYMKREQDEKTFWNIHAHFDEILSFERIKEELEKLNKKLEYQRSLELCANRCREKFISGGIRELCIACKELYDQQRERELVAA